VFERCQTNRYEVADG